jgi:hypothetical protein
VLRDPISISKRLISSDFSPAEQVKLIKGILADKDEQQAAKGLEPGGALKFVETLDLVCLLYSFPITNILREIDLENGRTGRFDSAYLCSLLGPSLWVA